MLNSFKTLVAQTLIVILSICSLMKAFCHGNVSMLWCFSSAVWHTDPLYSTSLQKVSDQDEEKTYLKWRCNTLLALEYLLGGEELLVCFPEVTSPVESPKIKSGTWTVLTSYSGNITKLNDSLVSGQKYSRVQAVYWRCCYFCLILHMFFPK